MVKTRFQRESQLEKMILWKYELKANIEQMPTEIINNVKIKLVK